MSSESIDVLWDESITKLKQLLQQEEDIRQHDESTTSKSTSSTPSNYSIFDAFHHFAKLYIQYTIIASDLNFCYESCIQPQKRQDIKVILEHILGRILNLRHLLVKWCPPNPDVVVATAGGGGKGGGAGGAGAQAPFPWEYFDISREMKELSCPPSRFEMTTPNYFGENQKDAILHRNATVIRLMEEKFGSEMKVLESKVWAVEETAAETEENLYRRKTAKVSNVDGGQKEVSRVESMHDVPPEQAATTIQPIVRGHLSRKLTANAKQWLDRFVGLTGFSNDDRPEFVKLEKNLIDIRQRRKQEQQYCKESYDNDLLRLKDVVREEEGFAMQDELREERIKWITEQTISNNALPESFEGFYASDESPDDKENEPKLVSASKDKTVKGSKDADRTSKNKKSAEVELVERPVLRASTLLLDPIKHCVQIYDERWKHRNVGPDRIPSQQHDVEMAKSLIVRDQVKSELTKKIEDKLLSNILKINAVQEGSASTNKSKSKNKEKGESQKAAKTGKKAGTKEKPLPGEALPGMKDKSVEEMLGVLIQHGLVVIPKGFTLKDFIGGFENDRPASLRKVEQERWIPDHPSAFQLRKSVMEYCILPLGSQSIRTSIQDNENVRSILFYGPEGSGKTRMVQTIASEIGAVLIHLSSSSIGNSFGGKDGATALIHMAFTVAKSKEYAPVILYIDNCHEFFLGKSKRRGMNSPATIINAEMQRFQRDLLVYKNQALRKEDRVLVIGCTNVPEYSDVKLMRWKGSDGKPEKQGFFDRSLYFSRANHADREMLWKEFIRQRLSECKCKQEESSMKLPTLDFDALACMSDGFNAGEILSIVNSVVTDDRVANFLSTPLSEYDFARYFPRRIQQSNDNDDDTRFLNFTRQITNLDSVWWKLMHGGGAEQQTKKK